MYHSAQPDRTGNPIPKPHYSGSAPSLLRNLAIARAATLARMGYLDKAESILQPFVTSQWCNEDVLVLQAKIYAQQNRLDLASQTWQLVLEANPFHAEAQHALKRITTAEPTETPQARKKRLFFRRGVFFFTLYFVSLALVYIYSTNWMNCQTILSHYLMGLFASYSDEAPQSSVSVALLEPTPAGTATPEPETATPSPLPTALPTLLETVLPSEIPSSATTTEVIQPATPMLEPELAASPTPSMAESVAEVTAIAPGRIDAATTALVEATAPETMPASLQEQVIRALQAQDLYEKFGLVVRQQGQMIQIEGSVPTIKTRFMIENCARKVEGVHFVDIGRLQLYQSYVVQPGDTLSKIAEKLYGNPAYQKDIAALNQIKSANQILVGQSLALPIIE